MGSYGPKGVFNAEGKCTRIEGQVATDTARVENSRRDRSNTSQAKRFRTFQIGPYRKRARGK